jgi:hypothetical protein
MPPNWRTFLSASQLTVFKFFKTWSYIQFTSNRNSNINIEAVSVSVWCCHQTFINCQEPRRHTWQIFMIWSASRQCLRSLLLSHQSSAVCESVSFWRRSYNYRMQHRGITPGLLQCRLLWHVIGKFQQSTARAEHTSLGHYAAEKREPAMPTQVQLQWLSVQHRVTFKLATFTFKILITQQPSYICDLINIYLPNRNLCSSS